MKNYKHSVMTLALAGLAWGSAAPAQQPTATSSQQLPAASAPKPATASKSATGQAAGTAKPGPATGAKKPATAATGTLLKTEREKRSYAVGLNIGKKVASELKNGQVDVDSALVARGIRDSMTAGKPLLTDAEAQAQLKSLETELRAKAQAEYEAMSSANQKAGDEFLAANKSKDGVTTLASGLQYKIIKEGTGPKPAATDSVSCNYRGTLVDGKEFDSSEKHGGQPVTFTVNQVIKGWSEALQLMPVGSKWQLFVPSDLAYGGRGMGQEIGPNTALVFEVELVSIAPKAEPAKGDTKPETK